VPVLTKRVILRKAVLFDELLDHIASIEVKLSALPLSEDSLQAPRTSVQTTWKEKYAVHYKNYAFV